MPGRRLALAGAVVLSLAVLATACSGGDNGGATGTPTGTGVPSGSGGPLDAFIIYRDGTGNLTARNVGTNETYQYAVDYNTEVVVAAACSPGGLRLGLLKQPFSVQNRQLFISGEDAPGGPLDLPSAVQGLQWSPDSERITFTEFDGFANVHKISILDPATEAVTELASGEGVVGSPGWSPDGTTIAYSVQDILSTMSSVFVIDAGGGEPRQVPASDDLLYFDPEWTPDGTRLLVSGQGLMETQLYTIDPATGEKLQLTASADIYKRGAEYAPNGATIAYTGSLLAVLASRYAMDLHSYGIFTLNADGSNEQALTVDPRTNPGAQVDPYLDAFLLDWCLPGPWLNDDWQRIEETPAP
jgi:hypothetical protein